MLLHQAVQRGLLWPVALVVDRGAIAMRPPGLVRVGLHALGMENLEWCGFSGRAGQRIRLWGGSSTPRRHGNGPAAAQHPARERRRRPCGSSHCAMASPARSVWVSCLARRLRSPLSAMLTAPAQTLCQPGSAKISRHHCCCEPHEVGTASAPFNCPLAESARRILATAWSLEPFCASRNRPG